MREQIKHLTASLAGLLAIGIVLALIGPFGTYELLPLPARLAYWVLVATLNGALVDVVIRQVDTHLPDATPLRRLLAPLIGAALAAVPATAIVAVANGLFGLGWPDQLLRLYSQVVFLLAVISTLVYTLLDLQELAEKPRTTSAKSEAEANRQEPGSWARFRERLPVPPTGDLLCLEMHDHYLAVHTTEGKQLILCRMEDAARELDDLGLRVHRSWWVASAAVAGAKRQGQRLVLTLIDKRQVPVGRTYRESLRQAGWLNG
ncbi:LytTR family DNA-binding domain-containing protein [Halopseudomonas salegens]|uniref:Transcriptional regulator, LytTR family n=1 Tax=Halopseudomonas salegens TaxID=1434072 RepID=A0A1H2F920_9GAMM|nr:LytTR family DNA-binding domain-containing protein [Halopseudomonas salegens]SDU03817.1 transcriptional regulator, LytTR family [Halopseudomonas salegens]